MKLFHVHGSCSYDIYCTTASDNNSISLKSYRIGAGVNIEYTRQPTYAT